jgi:hypothetical protein
MDTSEPDTQGNNKAESAATKLTIQQIRGLGAGELPAWVRGELPGQLVGGEAEALREANITGYAFLELADNAGFFREQCKLSPGTSIALASLARRVVEGDAVSARSRE